jgi:hypothetical protein
LSFHRIEKVSWPWGTNEPALRTRLAVSVGISVVLCLGFYATHYWNQPFSPAQPIRSDFSQLWYGAQALLHGKSPYEIIGPGLAVEYRWPATYPATAYLLAIPFTLLSEQWAAELFVGLGSFLLVFGATRRSWHLLPIFASGPFITGLMIGQVSVLITAILFLPSLAFLACVKPQVALPFLITKRRVMIAIVAGLIALLITLVILPRWPAQWLGRIASMPQFRPPVMRLGGFLILLVLLRWRRPEAMIVALMAVMPQTWYPYNWLPLLALASTYREACILTIVASVGTVAGEYAVYGLPSNEVVSVGGGYGVAFAYLPAVWMILRRPNIRARSG